MWRNEKLNSPLKLSGSTDVEKLVKLVSESLNFIAHDIGCVCPQAKFSSCEAPL